MMIRTIAAVMVGGFSLTACLAQPEGGAGGGGASAALQGERPGGGDAGSAGAASRATVTTDGSLAPVVERLGRDLRDVERFYDVPWSEVRWGRVEELLAAWEQELVGIDFESLDAGGRIDWLLMRHHLREQRDGLSLQRGRLEEMAELLPFRDAIVGLEVERWRIEPVDPRAMAAVVDEIAEMVEEAKGRVKRAEGDGSVEGVEGEEGEEGEAGAEGAEDRSGAGPRQATSLPHPASREAASGQEGEGAPGLEVEPAVALRAASAVGSLRRTLEGTIGAYIDHKPGFEWWLGSPREKAVGALRDYENTLRRDIAGIKGEDDDPLVGDPIGREALLADLRTEMIVYTPEELIAIAERELAWRQEEMVRAAREMGFGDDWRGALEEVKTHAVDPGEQDLYVAEVSREVIEFLKDRDLVTIPPLCEELWRAEMIPGHRQAMFPFAYYGGLHVGVAYPTNDMSHEDKLASMRGNNRHFTRNVVPHELIPGHHLQSFMAARHNAHRGLFSTPFLVEGWALYWEMTLWDAGWAQGPEDRMGILFWGMHRCARIIVSLKYHLGEMPAEEMIDFLIDEIGHERFGATSEVRRYIGDSYSPLYQVAYMIGGLQFRALRAEVVDGGLMGEKAFHDAILRYGPIPIELIRAGLLDEELPREWEASWRWDGGGGTGAVGRGGMMNDAR